MDKPIYSFYAKPEKIYIEKKSLIEEIEDITTDDVYETDDTVTFNLTNIQCYRKSIYDDDYVPFTIDLLAISISLAWCEPYKDTNRSHLHYVIQANPYCSTLGNKLDVSDTYVSCFNDDMIPTGIFTDLYTVIIKNTTLLKYLERTSRIDKCLKNITNYKAELMDYQQSMSTLVNELEGYFVKVADVKEFQEQLKIKFDETTTKFLNSIFGDGSLRKREELMCMIHNHISQCNDFTEVEKKEICTICDWFDVLSSELSDPCEF